MDFRLSSDQAALRDSARTLFARESPPALVRARYADPDATADVLWKHVADSGWTALTVPEAYGGLGLSVIELSLVLEEAGRVLAPAPLWESAGLAVPLLREAGSEAQQAEWLPRLATGEITATALLPGGPFAPEAQVVDVVVVGAGDRVEVMERPAVETLASLDPTRTLCRLAAAPVAGGAVERALEEATVALCAEMVGVARWLLDTTVAYAKEREQFGVPIGSFQAIKHKLADMLLDVERASAATYYAAMCVAADDADRTRAASVAKAACGDAVRRAAKDGIQIHGGIGYTWEHDLHLYIRRAYADEALLGTSADHHDRLAELVL